MKHDITISANAPLQTAYSALRAIKSYRIRWAWQQGRKMHTAVTTWLHSGDAASALRNFKQRRPEAVTAVVVEEAA